MNKHVRSVFLTLVLVQALHSVDEYIGRLWEVFPPARFLCSLVSENLETGFLTINIGLITFGLLCWLLLILNYQFISGFIWFWVIIELINGIGHPTWALSEGGYVPGLVTAPVLLILAVSLIKLLGQQSKK
jgi:hypothetical protein